jgi:membrane-bound lytic murein transglycosylase C
MFKKVLLLFIVISLTSCKSIPNLSSIRSAESLVKQINASDTDLITIAHQTVETNRLIQKNINNIRVLLEGLS